MNINFIRSYGEIGLEDIALVGGKNASLGEMYQNLVPLGLNLPEGFVITSEAYSEIVSGDLRHRILELLKFDSSDVAELNRRSLQIQEMIRKTELSDRFLSQLFSAFEKLKKESGLQDIEVAVRSSATAEDLPDASFAGQQETFLNVRNQLELRDACINCIASLFTARAISYRNSHGIDHESVKLSVGVQRMVRTDLASSGVIFTLDTESGSRDVILLTSSYGLGENIVGGRVDPDEFWVSKPILSSAEDPILKRKLGQKQMRMVYSTHGSQRTKNLDVSPTDRNKLSLTDAEVIYLSKQALIIESYYSRKYNRQMPMDIEWGKDGKTGKIFILQARPETVHTSISNKNVIMTLEKRSEVLLEGRAVGTNIGSGVARVIKNKRDLESFQKGEILIADMTDPDWEPIMKKASAIITNRGGRTCHAAIVSREHGVPCLVGTGVGTEILKTGQLVTVSCADGETGHVYNGLLPIKKEIIDINSKIKTRTKVMVNLGNPDEALKASVMPVSGVGLARMEFIIAESVRIHPMALLHPERLEESVLKNMTSIVGEYKKGSDYFIRRLSEGIGMIAGAFYPRPVIVRLSDFKTNEYCNLIGGKAFEPVEENPMIGFRGASRYYHPNYAEGFALECKAIKYCREKMGLKNIKIMVPFCRSVKEGIKVISELEKNGLIQGKDDLEVYVMCELPSNVLDAKAFGELFDGFSVGSNDLTQMTLGVDRDSELISDLFDERDPAALRMINMAVSEGLKAGIPVGICGQAPSDYPEICENLVRLGITSISLSPDSVFKALRIIIAAEKEVYGESFQNNFNENYPSH